MEELVIEILQIAYRTLIPMLLTGLIAFAKSEKKRKEDAHRVWQDSMSDIKSELSNLKEEVHKQNVTIDENTMRTSRYRIIRFDDEMQNNVYHSDDHCDQILEDIDIYDAYCKAHPDFKNHKGQGAMHRILSADAKGELRVQNI